jgi:hypothetical protein
MVVVVVVVHGIVSYLRTFDVNRVISYPDLYVHG